MNPEKTSKKKPDATSRQQKNVFASEPSMLKPSVRDMRHAETFDALGE